MKNYVPLSSLAMDLKRAALGWQRNSAKLAGRFYLESLKRKREIDTRSIPPYIVNLLSEVEQLEKIKDNLEKGEKALLLSTLFQNAAVTLSKISKD